MAEEEYDRPLDRSAEFHACDNVATNGSETSGWPLSDIAEPLENDIVIHPMNNSLKWWLTVDAYGSIAQDGQTSNDQPGWNPQFCALLQKYWPDYEEASRLEKPTVALQVVHAWRTNCIPSGRFLRLDSTSGLWFDVGDRKARAKISKLFSHRLSSEGQPKQQDEEQSTKSPLLGEPQEKIVNEPQNNNLRDERIPGQVENDADLKHNTNPSLTLGSLGAEPVLEEKPVNIRKPYTSLGSRMTSRQISTSINYARTGGCLFGRSEEQQELARIFHGRRERCLERKHADMVFIAGGAGSGKTALAHTLQPLVQMEGGLFVATKFEMLDSQGPLAAYLELLRRLARQLLELDVPTRAIYRQGLIENAADETRLLGGVIPQLNELLGTSDSTSNQRGNGAQTAKRMEFAFCKFIRTLAMPDRPIALLFDDLHWAEDSLYLLSTLIVDAAYTSNLLLIGTYRQEEGTELKNPLVSVLASTGAAFSDDHSILLEHLSQDAIMEMVADSLGAEPDHIKGLGATLYARTRGNVLFLLELLRSLQHDDVIRFDEHRQEWVCDMHLAQVSIGNASLSQLIQAKVKSLPENVQETLKVAACLGAHLDVKILSRILSPAVTSHCQHALALGLLSRENQTESFLFRHDCVQEAVYDLIRAADVEDFHYKIGRRLWRNVDFTNGVEESVFVIVKQLSLGQRYLTDEGRKCDLAALCLHACRKAVTIAGFRSAYSFLKQGMDLLPGDRPWRDHYHIALQLHNAAAEVCYCLGRFDDLERYVSEVLFRARTFEDTLHIRATQTFALGSQGRYIQAVEFGLDTLEHIGMGLPMRPNKSQVFVSFFRINRLLGKTSDEAILSLPPLSDPIKIAGLHIMNLLILPSLRVMPLLSPIMACRMIRMTIEEGVSAASCMGFASLGAIYASSKVEIAYRCGQLALNLCDALNTDAYNCRVTTVVYGCINVWKDPVKDCVPFSKQAYARGMQSGDLEYAALSASMFCWNSMDSLPLPVLEQELSRISEQMTFLGQRGVAMVLQPIWQMFHNFMGRAGGDPKVLKGEVMDFQAFLVVFKAQPSKVLMHVLNFYHAYLAYYFSDFEKAELLSAETGEFFKNALTYGSSNSKFYECMSVLARTTGRADVRRLRRVRHIIKKLRTWAHNAPENHLGKLYLVEAEVAAVSGDHRTASLKYYSAILHLRDAGFLVLEALANERFGKYHRGQGDIAASTPYLVEACRLYQLWGGTEKLRHLKNEMNL